MIARQRLCTRFNANLFEGSLDRLGANDSQLASQPEMGFLYVDVNVKHKGQAEICEPIGDRFCRWLEGGGVGPRAA